MTILVIVESRAKAPKIEKMLGKGYTVRPCYGHVQDVQHSLKWIDGHAQAGWDPDTIPYTPAKDALKKKTMTELRKLAATASKIVIASDMDREGEAIGYHLCDLLKVKSKKTPTERIVFDQITPEAIQAAIANPTTLREPFYRAQQARRVIDLLFGYTVSPLLWGIAHKLSAGRCQSPALRWLWERQQAFLNMDKVDPKHDIVVQLVKQLKTGATKGQGGCTSDGTVVQGTYQQAKGKGKKRATDKDELATADPASDPAAAAGVDESVLHELVTFPRWLVVDTTASQPHQAPPLPLTTSALQQKAYGRWKWSPKRTMSVAQKLYEGGHITYMRTDCKVLSAPFVAQATAYLRERFGAEYLGGGVRSKTAKGKGKKQAHAQEAHEPVRPVYAKREYLGGNQATAEGQKLYRLIYETTLSSLMAPCVLNKLVVMLHPHVEPPPAKAHVVKADCTEMHFPGHRVWEVKDQLPWASRRPDVAIGDVYDVHEYQSKVHHAITNKPYTSGDLLKLLETRGVGRPSTYSSILDTLETRKYTTTGEPAWQAILKDHPLSGVQNKDVRIDMRQSPPAWAEKVLCTDLAKQVKDRFNVTPLGTEVIGYLVTNLAEMIDADFTKSLEDDLDAIVQGTKTYPEVVGGFYTVLQQRVKGAKALTSSRPSGGPAFVNGHAKRTLQETDEWQVVAMQTKFGPAVALFYKDPKRKKEGVFANIQSAQLDAITYEEAKPILDAKQQADANGTAKQGHHVGTTADGVDVYAKGGPYGNYLTWTDAAGRAQTTTFPDKNLAPTAVTLAQATEWMAGAQLTLHKVSALYTVKYNAKKESVYLSKSQGKGKRGRPTYAPLDAYGKDDLAKFKKLTVKECDALMEAAAAAKATRGRGASGRGRGRGRGRGASAAAGGAGAGVKKKRSSSKKQKVRASKKKEG